jgi:hypothetical protein
MAPQLHRGTPSPPPVLPPRSPERQKLADAISLLADAVASAEKIEEARQKLDNRRYDVLEPAVRAAKRELEEAIADAPAQLVAAVLEGGIAEDVSAVAKIELRQAETAVEQARSARAVLFEEAQRAEGAITAAQRGLDRAVSAVVSADPARQAVLAEFQRFANHALRCAQILRTCGMIVRGAEAHGLMFRVVDAPVPMGKTSFTPDREWASATRALRDDPDAPLPGLPAEDDPAGDAGSRAA